MKFPDLGVGAKPKPGRRQRPPWAETAAQFASELCPSPSAKTGGRLVGIYQAAFDRCGGRGHFCRLYPSCPHKVVHGASLIQQIVGHNPPVAAPPDGLGAHDGTGLLAAPFK